LTRRRAVAVTKKFLFIALQLRYHFAGMDMRRVWDDREIHVSDDNQIAIRDGGRWNFVRPTLEHVPESMVGLVRHMGVASDGETLDFSIVRLAAPATAAAVYTRSLCVSPAVTFDRRNTDRGAIQLVCVVSKNASVFTPRADADISKLADALAREFSVERGEILISCTGVIGKPLPLERILGKLPGLAPALSAEGFAQVPQAILTTDKRAKCASIRVGNVVIGGYAKGAGMLEPNMATMLVYLYTNARLEKPLLDRALKQAADRTFNALSVDSDTSTSDTVALLATGQSPPADQQEFDTALTAVCLHLTQAIAREAEGATKLLEVTVGVPTSHADALFFAKKVVNSPLVKTAIHGADPNWGRVVMAIGKPMAGSPLLEVPPDALVISMQGMLLYNCGRPLTPDLPALSRAMKSADRVAIEVEISRPVHKATVWGCDLSSEYVAENAHYTT
jgi:glutamate N-acetyltransferase/amino-acid N-acetyltransferase